MDSSKSKFEQSSTQKTISQFLKQQSWQKPYLVSPQKPEDLLSISTKISASTAQQSQTLNYIVNNALQTIRKIQGNRVETEGQIIQNLISQTGKLLFMLHMDWASIYTEYLQRKNQKPPGPINNTTIFVNQEDDCSQEINYKPDLQQDQDFVLLNRNTWLFIHQLYGGGPEVLYLDYLKETQSKRINDLKLPEDLCLQNSLNFNHSFSRISSMQSLTFKVDSSACSYISIQLPYQNSEYELPPVGFYNESNFCFMNSSMQGLLSIEKLNRWVMIEGKNQVENRENPQEICPYLLGLVELVMTVSQKKAGSYIKVQKLKDSTSLKFNPSQQHDSQEFIRFLIEKINDEIEKKDKYFQSITDILFQGQFLSIFTCQECKNKSSKFESFLDLSVSMQHHITLDECLQKFFEPEVISNDYACSNCKQRTTVVRHYVIGTPPTILMIHLKRFNMKVKLHGYLSFPVELNISEYSSSAFQPIYRLRSVIVHYGTPEKGHYVNFSLRQNQWYYFDDHKIYSVTEQDILDQQAYILFYEQYEDNLVEEILK